MAQFDFSRYDPQIVAAALNAAVFLESVSSDKGQLTDPQSALLGTVQKLLDQMGLKPRRASE